MLNLLENQKREIERNIHHEHMWANSKQTLTDLCLKNKILYDALAMAAEDAHIFISHSHINLQSIWTSVKKAFLTE